MRPRALIDWLQSRFGPPVVRPDRVLVVEDDQDLADITAEVLEAVGYEVRTAAGGTAVAVARAFAPRVVLLDLMMPDKNGVEVARELRDDPATAAIPIIVLTAKEAPTAIDRHMPVDDWLAKPYSLRDLYATVGRWVQHPR